MREVTSRSEARAIAVIVLYQLFNTERDLSTERALEFALEAANYPEEPYDKVTNHYLFELINGTMSHITEIDEAISQYLIDWSLDRLAKVDLTILRLAFYEIMYIDRDEVPLKVIADEAIELSKLFSDNTSARFVGGVLAKVIEQNK